MTDQSPIEIYEADGLRLIVPITIAAGAGFNSFAGGTAEVHVRSRNDTAIEGVATITGPLEATAVFAPWEVPAAAYTIQLRAAQPATAMQTILEDDLIVKRSLRPPV